MNGEGPVLFAGAGGFSSRSTSSSAPTAPCAHPALVTFCPALTLPAGADHFPPVLSFPFPHIRKVTCPGQGRPSPRRPQELLSFLRTSQERHHLPPEGTGLRARKRPTSGPQVTTPQSMDGEKAGCSLLPFTPAHPLWSHWWPLHPSRPGQAPLISLDPSRWEVGEDRWLQ